jgi:hypothetical protein
VDPYRLRDIMDTRTLTIATVFAVVAIVVIVFVL